MASPCCTEVAAAARIRTRAVECPHFNAAPGRYLTVESSLYFFLNESQRNLARTRDHQSPAAP
jgi:hypothetical protein